MNDDLTDEELSELANLLPPGAITTVFLRRAKFPPGQLPAVVAGQNSEEYWELIRLAIIDGTFPDGAKNLRAAVRRRWPANKVFADPAGPVRRVLLIGAAPVVADPEAAPALRTAEEYRAVVAAAPSLTVDYLSAATAGDIRRVLDRDPDVLHLACHGRRGGVLLFPAEPSAESGAAPVRTVHAADLADAIAEYQRQNGARGGRDRLHGIVLNACYSAEAGEALRPCAHTVVAHQAELPDRKAPLLAGALYERIVLSGSLARAARIVKAELPLLDDDGRPLRDGIVIFEDGKLPITGFSSPS
jgi:hypothetical protein